MKKFNKGIFTLGVGALAFGLASCGSTVATSSTAEETPTSSVAPVSSEVVETSAVESTETGTVVETSTEVESTEPESTEPVDDYVLKIVTPSGAPAVALADLAKNKSEKYEVTTIADPSLYFLDKAEDVTADVIVAPVNAGAKMYKNTGKFQLAGVVTWGNLYFVSKSEFTMSDVKAEDTILFGEGKIPGMIVDYVLSSYDVEPISDANHMKNAVNDVFTALKTSKEDDTTVYLLAEPVLTVAMSQISGLHTISVQDEYKKLTGEDTYPQAGLFVRKTTADAHKSVIDTLIADVTAGSNLLKSDVATYATYVNELGFLPQPVAVLQKALPKCAVNFVIASEAKAAIEKEVAIDPSMFGGAVPADGFYYA